MTIPRAIADDPDVFAPTEIAEALGVHRGTVWGWIQSGMLQAERRGAQANFYAVRRRSLVQFLAVYPIPVKNPSYLERASVLDRRRTAQLRAAENRLKLARKRKSVAKKPKKGARKKRRRL